MIHRRGPGFTIIELLIVMSITLVISLAIAMCYRQSYNSFNHGSARTQLQQKTRIVMQRMAPILMSAFANPADADPLASPPVEAVPVYEPANIGSSSNNLVVSTTEDWLNPNYPDAATSSMAVANVSDLNYFNYRIALESGNIVLTKVQNSGGSFTPVSGIPTRVLARTDTGGTISTLIFTRLSTNAVRVRISTQTTYRGDNMQQSTLNYELDSILNITAESLR